MKIRDLLVVSISIVIALTLAASAYRHLDNPFYFLSTIYSYRMTGQQEGIMLAIFLPPLQLMIAIVLLFDRAARRVALILASILFTIFSIAQISAFSRELNIACGCFGASTDNPIGPLSISLAVGGVILSIVGACLCRSKSNTPIQAPEIEPVSL